jgi:hypothetical protein
MRRSLLVGEEIPGAGRTQAAPAHEGRHRMTLGLRALLMLLATILFIVAALNNDHFSDLVAIGLACLAGAFLVEDTGLATRFGTRRRS